MTDEDYMQLAMQAARSAASVGEVPVGAVIVSPNGDVIATAGNRPIADHDPSAHAEILAIRQACKVAGNYRLPEHRLYVTLEPCTMCAGAISNARLSVVIFGASDPKGGALKSGVQFFESSACHHKPDIISGVLADESADLLKDFFRARRKLRSPS